MLSIDLSVVSPIVLFVEVFHDFMTLQDILNGFFLLIYIYIYSMERKWHCCEKKMCFIFLKRNYFSIKIFLLKKLLNFILGVTRPNHVFHLLCREILFWSLNRENIIVIFLIIFNVWPSCCNQGMFHIFLSTAKLTDWYLIFVLWYISIFVNII